MNVYSELSQDGRELRELRLSSEELFIIKFCGIETLHEWELWVYSNTYMTCNVGHYFKSCMN